MGKTRKATVEAGKPSIAPTAREKTSLLKQIARLDSELPTPRIKVVEDGAVAEISLHHPNEQIAEGLLAEALGTSDFDFVRGILSQIVTVSSLGGKIDEGAVNFVLAIIKDIKPNDQLEAMLALQMAIAHLAQVKYSTMLGRAEYLSHQDSAER